MPDNSAVIAELSNKFAAVEDTGSLALAGAELHDGDLAVKGEPMDAIHSGSGSIDEGVEKVRPGSFPYQLSAVSTPPFPISPPPADNSMTLMRNGIHHPVPH